MSFAQKTPARSTLAAAIKKIRAETLEAINHLVLLEAQERKVENGQLSRVDCTVVEKARCRTHLTDTAELEVGNVDVAVRCHS